MSAEHSHLHALELGLSHERGRLHREKSEKGKALRRVWITQIEKEIREERKFLGLEECLPDITDEELLAALEQ